MSAAQSWLRQKWSRAEVEARLANVPPCLIGMEALRWCASPEPETARAWPRCPTDAGEIFAALFEGAEERLPRRRSNRRGGAAADHEIWLPGGYTSGLTLE